MTSLRRSNITQCTWYVTNGVCQSNIDFLNIFRANPETSSSIYFNDEKVVDDTIHVCIGDMIELKGSNPHSLYERGQWVSFGPSLSGINGDDVELKNIQTVDKGVQQVGWFIFDKVSGCAPNRQTFSIEVHEKPEVDANTLGGSIITINAMFPNTLDLSGSHSGDLAYWSTTSLNVKIVDSLDLKSEIVIEGNGNKEMILTSINEGCKASDTVYLELPLGIDHLISKEMTVNEFEDIANKHQDAILYLYDLQGKLLQEVSQSELVEWRGSRLKKGIYIYHLLFNSASQSLSGRLEMIE